VSAAPFRRWTGLLVVMVSSTGTPVRHICSVTD
jgi:hypothetical protein